MKDKKITLMILLITIVSVVITGLILLKLMQDTETSVKENWFFQESIETGQPVELKNAYITSTADHKLVFIHDMQVYEVKGHMNEDYTGVANIIVNGSKVEKVTVDLHKIHVVIKNTDDIFYDELFIKRKTDGELLQASKIFKNTKDVVYEIQDPLGLYICDKDGNCIEDAYEGSFRIYDTSQGFVLVNDIPLETYLKYVVPSEMLYTYDIEALKAQAVCARTYALSQMGNKSYALYGANIDDSTSFQAYHNTGRTENTDRAVDETKDQVILNQNTLITCYYYSTSPGVTNDMDTWECDSVDYISCVGLDQANGLNLQIESDFSKFISQQTDCYDSKSPFYRWSAILNLKDSKENDKGLLRSISVKARNSAGYITALELVYTKENEILRNEYDIRKTLGSYLEGITLNDGTIRKDIEMIPSACFEVVSIDEDQIEIRGGGFGHGIGMSQHGANQMAKDGFDYMEILSYYYENIEVKSLEFSMNMW